MRVRSILDRGGEGGTQGNFMILYRWGGWNKDAGVKRLWCMRGEGIMENACTGSQFSYRHGLNQKLHGGLSVFV